MQQSKAIVELESAELQLALFNTLKPEEQLQYLRENLDELERGTALDKSRELIKAWEKADIAAFEALMQQTLKDTSVSGRFLKQVLLDQRNPGMADKIVELMQQRGKSFVAVGLLHLLGEGSVPALLQKRGYVVERVDCPAPGERALSANGSSCRKPARSALLVTASVRYGHR